MNDMKCPFCKEELSYAQEIDGGFEILTCDCPHGIWLFGNDKMWYNLEKAITELERTRKALDLALEALTTIGGYLDYNDCVGIALDAKDEIYKVLEQKDK